MKSRIALVIAIVLIAAEAALFGVLAFQSATKNAGTLPEQVSATKKITVASDNGPIVLSPAVLVEDTGAPEWVQIKSKGSQSEKVENLSGEYTGITLYRIHSPQILKTATTVYPQLQYMYQLEETYPKALIMNASGYNMLTGQITGFQLNNGKLFQDWSDVSTLHAKAAFIVYKNGSTGVVNSAESASRIIANGGMQSYSFGSILVKDGKIQPDDGSVNWEIHSFIGADKNDNLILMISDTMAWSRTVLSELTAEYNLESLVVLDGGGSSQMSYQGYSIYPSQDGRPISDFVVVE